MRVSVSVPGKLHLLGEHSVVYGEPAILSAIDQRLYLTCAPSREVVLSDAVWSPRHVVSHFSRSEISRAGERLRILWEEGRRTGDFSPLFSFGQGDEFLGYRQGLLGITLDSLGIVGGVTIELRGELPMASGLGSSAAYAVALVGACTLLSGRPLELGEVNELAHRLEQFVHGSASGGDNTTCCYGGVIWFERREGEIAAEPLQGAEMLCGANFGLVQTRKSKRSTGEMVQRVRELDPAYREPRVRELGRLAREVRGAVEAGRAPELGAVIRCVQRLLSELGVSTDEIGEIVGWVEDRGGAAKLCGAGGGGGVLIYHPELGALGRELSALGYRIQPLRLSAPGFRVEEASL